MTTTTKLWMCRLLILSMILQTQTVWVSAMSPLQHQSSLTVRVCSGCLSRCRGSFNPLTSFEQLIAAAETEAVNDDGAKMIAAAMMIRVEESLCMNQCKKGPIVRIINDDNKNVLTFDETLMSQPEKGRSSFQRVLTEERVKGLWRVANGVVDGEIIATENGSVDKLRDIMPKKDKEKKKKRKDKEKEKPSVEKIRDTMPKRDKEEKKKKKKDRTLKDKKKGNEKPTKKKKKHQKKK